MWFAVAGAAAMLLAGPVGWLDIVQLGTDTGPVLAFLGGMLVVGFVADQAGVFTWLAYHTARLSRGNGRLLYVGLYGIGVFITVWFSLDTTAVVLAPIVYSLVQSLGLPPMPFVLATTYVANTASLLLPVSNLTNLIVWNQFHIPFWTYARIMVLPSIIAVTINLVLFLWLFRRHIPHRFAMGALSDPHPALPPHSDQLQHNSNRLVRCLIVLAAILIGLAVAPFFGWELWVVAVVGALILSGLEVAAGHLQPRRLGTGISWDLLPFVFSLFLILRGVSKSGLADVIQTMLVSGDGSESFLQLLAVAATTALGANLINNLPMLLVAVDSLAAPVAAGQVGLGTVYAALLGANLGPNLTIIGSLATMLSLSIIGKRGMKVPGTLYIKIGLITVPLLLIGSAAGLWLSLHFFG